MSLVQTSRTRLWPNATELVLPYKLRALRNQEVLPGRTVVDRLSHLGGDSGSVQSGE